MVGNLPRVLSWYIVQCRGLNLKGPGQLPTGFCLLLQQVCVAEAVGVGIIDLAMVFIFSPWKICIEQVKQRGFGCLSFWTSLVVYANDKGA